MRFKRPPRIAPSYFLAIWLGLGFATVLIPLTVFIGARATNSLLNLNQAGNYNNGGGENMQASNSWWSWSGGNQMENDSQDGNLDGSGSWWNWGGNQWQDEEAVEQDNVEEEEEAEEEQEDDAQEADDNNQEADDDAQEANDDNQGDDDGQLDDNYEEQDVEGEEYGNGATPWWYWGKQSSVAREEYERREGTAPWWYWGGHQGENAREDFRAPPSAYLWSLLIFFSILFFGFRAYRAKGNLLAIEVPLIMFACYCILAMFLFSSVDGAVETEGRVVEEHGFLGQVGVLVYITSLLWLVFSVSSACVARCEGKQQADSKILLDDDVRPFDT